MGRWVSDRCGERTYRRVLELEAGGAARGQDLVSPCPPDVACVWSGIIPFEGSWKLEGERVSLSLAAKAHGEAVSPPLPAELSWSGGPVAQEGNESCAYRRP